MQSEIYTACEDGDINLVEVLINTSPDDADINRLEPNGNTALHIACIKGYTDIVRLFLNDIRVERHRMNNEHRTAYDVSSTKEIRQLFCRPQHNGNQFCDNQNIVNPLRVIINEDCSESRWITTYPIAGPISAELLNKVADGPHEAMISIVDWCKTLFGIDPYEKKFNKWFQDLQIHIEQCLIDEYLKKNCEPNYNDYSKACKCIKEYEKTRKIEHLLTLYTLHTSICQYFAESSERTNCLYEPILFDLFAVRNRSYQGLSFRGLTMKESEFERYKRAFYCPGSYIKTKTFCSTSVDPSVAEIFTDNNTIENTVNVFMCFEFTKSCATALILFSCLPQLKCISNYEDEQEILILPETIFSVKSIQENDQNNVKKIYLEHYNTDEEEAEMRQERFKSYIESCILDS